ncbi:hypothetical protein LTR97_005833 [Elasticomyces elasticus]|uniref:F-box domain-containing protein n=1 Tax=Elasticomyces elasticus TaxID=574655 RepID=A0AAN7VSF9_9PEZI|nr:hypothetical protein LTR97_005833 [Elasticomyces elasticus]KAK5721642.1 hypothetical protein LTR15_006231 [Elasticomyces elasticus]
MASKDSDMVVTTETPFHLLSLPPELWSRICRLGVTRQNSIEFSEAMSPREVETLVKQPAITLVCKTIREETIDLFYANSFVFEDTTSTEHNFWMWLRALRVEDSVKYSMSNLSIRSHFDLDPPYYSELSKYVSEIGLNLQRVGGEENEADLASGRFWSVYKLVPSAAV